MTVYSIFFLEFGRVRQCKIYFLLLLFLVSYSWSATDVFDWQVQLETGAKVNPAMLEQEKCQQRQDGVEDAAVNLQNFL